MVRYTWANNQNGLTVECGWLEPSEETGTVRVVGSASPKKHVLNREKRVFNRNSTRVYVLHLYFRYLIKSTTYIKYGRFTNEHFGVFV